MKERLLKLAIALKKTGIEELFKDVRSTEEFVICWQKFWKENGALAKQIKTWGESFAQSEEGPLFSFTEDVENPLEVAAIIKLINSPKVTEEQLFEDRDDLFNLLYDLQEEFATIVARTLENYLINEAKSLVI